MKNKNAIIKNLDQLSVAAIRSICIDGINKANSGHPGAALSAAPILYVLYRDFVVANPFQPKWLNRDRVILSYGHASMLLYTMLHLCSYNVSIEDLENFRQYKSITPGHPEVDVTEGVDASSGPLGQGIAEAVGSAMAETMLEAQYGSNIYNHYTYCVCGDGCLEEGISQEAITFAGLQKLNKLILLYDNNDVTLDGPLSQSNSEDTIKRFLSCGWDVIYVKDGNKVKDIRKAITRAKESKSHPTLIVFKTKIGFGSKNEGSHKAHGAPLGEEDGLATKRRYGYNYGPFEIPQEVYENFKINFLKRGEEAYHKHQELLEEFHKQNPKKIDTMLDLYNNDLTKHLNEKHLLMNELKSESTRKASQRVLNYYHELLPNFVGGSADVASSVMTGLTNGSTYAPKNRKGTNINWGIREFFMAAASNGILLHGGLRTYLGSFLVFSDYMKNAIRMASIMKLPQIFLFSHDSIAVGEDGPTHQPVEHLAMLRAIPNLNVFRPCDAKETYAAYRLALESKETPSAIILSRQNLPLLDNSSNYDLVSKGAYIIDKERGNNPDFTLIATGSEVSLAIEVKKYLFSLGLNIRVVSMPCQELFDKQSVEYQVSVLGNDYSHRMSLEMESSFGWHKYAKYAFGINEYGASAPMKDCLEAYGFTKENVAKIILKYIK